MDPKISIRSLLMNEYQNPYSLQEFYNHCKKFKCEELVDYIIAIYNYQTHYESPEMDDEQSDAVSEFMDQGPIRDRKATLSWREKTKRFLRKLSGKVNERPKIREPVEIEVSTCTSQHKRNSSSKNIEQKLLYIINTYTRSTSPRQINIPFHINNNLIKNYEGNMRGYSLFKESLEHCECILKTSPLPSFVLERKQFALKVNDY